MNLSDSHLNLIIGGNGFIGQTLTQSLKNQNKRALILDIDIWKSQGSRVNSNFEQFPLSDSNWKDRLLFKISGESEVVIWHLAANSDIAKASSNYEIDYKYTLGSTIDVIDLAMSLGSRCKRIVFTSSSAVYGVRKGEKLFLENDKLLPISNYGVMKEASEKILKIYSDRSETTVQIYRLANIVGSSMTHGLIFDLVNKLKSNPSKLNVLGDGNQRKTYLHVEDLVKIMENFIPSSQSFTMNVGPNDEGIQVREIVDTLLLSIGGTIEVEYENKPEGWAGDVTNSVMDTSSLFSKIDFQILGSLESIEKAIKSRLKEVL